MEEGEQVEGEQVKEETGGVGGTGEEGGTGEGGNRWSRGNR